MPSFMTTFDSNNTNVDNSQINPEFSSNINLNKTFSTKILCIFDGFGLNVDSPNNAISRAKMPNFRRLLKENFWTTLSADGESVGQEAGLVGNSEVGHMNIGGLKLVPQLSFQITKSSQNSFDLDKSITPDQLFDPKKFLENRWNEKIKISTLKKENCPVSNLLYQACKMCLDEEMQGIKFIKSYNYKMSGESPNGWNENFIYLEDFFYVIDSWILPGVNTNLQIITQELDECTNKLGLDFKNSEYWQKYGKTETTLWQNLKEAYELANCQTQEELLEFVKSELNQTLPKPKTIHLIGLFSTGCIHSDLRHWAGSIEASLLAGSEKIVLHIMTDGRDSDKKSLVATWQKFTEMLEEKMENLKLKFKENNLQSDLKNLENWQDKIFLGSVGGRFFGMDRDKNWERVAHGILAMLGQETENLWQNKLILKQKYEIKNLPIVKKGSEIDNSFNKISKLLTEITKNSYKDEKFDEMIIPQRIADNVSRGDTVWLINFRSDRMKQFGQMFCDFNTEFELNLTILANNSFGLKLETFLNTELEFDENINRFKKMPNYNYQTGQYYPIFKPQTVKNTLAQTISERRRNNFKFEKSKIENEGLQNLEKSESSADFCTQLHIAETEKYNHVTYFFNGGQDKKWNGEDWIVIPSNKVPSHAEMPEMKAREVTDKILELLGSNLGDKNCQGIKIREIQKEDCSQVLEILKNGWLQSDQNQFANLKLLDIEKKLKTVDYYDDILANKPKNSQNKLVLLINQEIIGFGSFMKLESQVCINDLYIQKEFQGQGFGKLLLENLLEKAKILTKKDHLKQIQIYYGKNNSVAENLYQKYGFVKVKTESWFDEYELENGQKAVLENIEMILDLENELHKSKIQIKECESQSPKYDYIIANFANPDMVGHTGDIPASISSMEFLDEQFGRLLEVIEKNGHEMIIIADHGNMEFVGEFQESGKILTDTEHNPSPVPCLFVGNKWKINNPNLEKNKKELLQNLTNLNAQKTVNLDLELISKILTQKNQTDLTKQENWLNKDKIDFLRSEQLPLWYSGAILLGL